MRLGIGLLLIGLLAGCARYDLVTAVTENGLPLRLSLETGQKWVYAYHQQTDVTASVFDTTFAVPHTTQLQLQVTVQQPQTNGFLVETSAVDTSGNVLSSQLVSLTPEGDIYEASNSPSPKIDPASMLRHLVDFIPEQPVKIGDQWQVTSPLNDPGTDSLTVYYTLQSIDTTSEIPTLRITCAGAFATDNIHVENTDHAVSLVSVGELTGVIIFAPLHGCVLQKEIEATQRVESTAFDRFQSEAVASTLTTRTIITKIL
ncbi:MAG: hypothetical protein D6675_11270 [Gemmatimonadetes bacterium]|nr:MAG: hypothetical protein D6675_11270 [Gemmatimonadota bacterium]